MFQQAFFEEAIELLNELETHLLGLEERKNDRELLNTIFRCAHSIKGGSATFGLPAIASFTHTVETLLDKVRSGVVQVSPDLCAVMFRSLDQMRALLGEAMGTAGAAPDSEALKQAIELLSDETSVMVAPEPEEGRGLEEKDYRLVFVPGYGVMGTGCDPCLLLGHLAQISRIQEVIRDDSQIPPLREMDPESCYVSWQILLSSSESREELLDTFDFISDESEIKLIEIVAASSSPVVADAPVVVEKTTKSETSMLRVPSEKVDKLVDLVGELVIAQSMLNEATQLMGVDLNPRLVEAIAAIERTSRELQERVMGIRLVQLKQAFARFPRLVHDLSASVGKRIDLVTSGEETELDKTLIDALGDPLTHLVRNSIDHGLETPSERLAAGKPETGVLRINSRYEGGSVIIEVSDDGRGLNRERILSKAREKGIVSDTDSFTDEQIDAIIFHPGFSTAYSVTDLSGRGVGMDIVRQAIQAMNGSLTLSTSPGQGTIFRIRLPLTMAILEGLSLRIGKEIYILPLTSIVESLRPSRHELTLVAGRHEIVRVRGEVLRLLRLHQAFNIASAISDPCEGILVIVENEGRKIALLVDELITQNQAVLKSLDANYRKVDGITGATILGDGRVALIIDVPGLFRGMSTEAGASLEAA